MLRISRSFKYSPVSKTTFLKEKKIANKRVRNYKNQISNGSSYRKIYDSYEIHDCINRYSFTSFKKDIQSKMKSYINGVENTNSLDFTNDLNFINSYDYWYRVYKNK